MTFIYVAQTLRRAAFKTGRLHIGIPFSLCFCIVPFFQTEAFSSAAQRSDESGDDVKSLWPV